MAPLMYLGAKHMVTGYDHLLFLVGVIFFLYRPRGRPAVRQPVHDRPQRHAARGRARRHPRQPVHHRRHHRPLGRLQGVRQHGRFPAASLASSRTRAPRCCVFGLFHGFGLATKLQDFSLPRAGLVTNIVSFNVGVEIGQMLALTGVLIALELLAHAARLHEARVRDQHGADDRRVSCSSATQLSGYFLTSHDAVRRRNRRRHAPTRKRLAVATAIALAVAALVLVAAVLPAEYGIDPLGTGKALGLTALFEADAEAEPSPWRKPKARRRRCRASTRPSRRPSCSGRGRRSNTGTASSRAAAWSTTGAPRRR